jgi:hypothetical protein
MSEMTIRLHYRRNKGQVEDAQHEFSLADFAGVLPAIGDTILHPGVVSGLPRDHLNSRRLLTVVGRVFNPKDLSDYVALIVEEHRPTEAERSLIP